MQITIFYAPGRNQIRLAGQWFYLCHRTRLYPIAKYVQQLSRFDH